MGKEDLALTLLRARFRHGCALAAIVALAAAAAAPSVVGGSSSCDLFQGRWVADASYPLYDAASCPFVPDVFDCRRNGRPDATYLKFRWSPAACRLPRLLPSL